MSLSKSNYLSWVFVLALTIIFTSTSTAFASIVPTNTFFDTPFHGYGSYEGTQERRGDGYICCNDEGRFYLVHNSLLARAELSANIASNRIDISGSAVNYTDTFDGSAGVSIGSSIFFDVDEPNLFDLSVASTALGFYSDLFVISPNITLKSAQGDIIVGCFGDFGCELFPGIFPPYHPSNNGRSSKLKIQLPKGSYVIESSVSTDLVAGITIPVSFELSLLKEVPLPASVWLLISGIFVIVRRDLLKILGATIGLTRRFNCSFYDSPVWVRLGVDNRMLSAMRVFTRYIPSFG